MGDLNPALDFFEVITEFAQINLNILAAATDAVVAPAHFIWPGHYHITRMIAPARMIHLKTVDAGRMVYVHHPAFT